LKIVSNIYDNKIINNHDKMLVGGTSKKATTWETSIKRVDSTEICANKIWCESDLSALEQGPVAGSCEHDNENFGFVKGEEFLV
jgi:hypothetical protein